LPVDELAKRFDMFSFSKAPARIGLEALAARNKAALSKADPEEIEEDLKERAPALVRRLGAPGLEALVDAGSTRVATYKELAEVGQFLVDEPAYAKEERALHTGAGVKKVMKMLVEALKHLPADKWSHAKLGEALDAFTKAQGTGYDAYQLHLRWMLTGVTDGLPVHHTLAVIGRDEALKRLGEFVR
jgi:glutamyl-tRNA synthetase